MMQKQDIETTLNYLTEAVTDARHKPNLRPVITSELLRCNYSADEVDAALDKFYEVRVQ